MNLINIIILSSIAFLTGIVKDSGWRKYIVLCLSIFALFYLQPALPIRYLSFWLPTITLFITVLSWILTNDQVDFKWGDTWITGGVIIVVILLVAASRYISSLSFLITSQPPLINQVLLALLFFFISAGLARKFPKSINTYWVIFLILIFVAIKTPYFTKSLSLILRNINRQSADLASSVDIGWLGFSYIAFRIIHTLRDRQSGKLPKVDLAEYINYVIFFPSLTAGPIDRLDKFITSFRSPVDDRFEVMGEGGKRIILGLFKKFVLADSLSFIALNGTNALQIRSSGWMWVSLYAFALQIFFDFSGYTDIAIGMGRLIGIKLPENFSSPYLKPNLTQFWNNWHMTLTQWFRAYFFNPLTRSLRSGKKVWSIPAIIFTTQICTMILIGLWHGVTINFVIWGAWHGLGLFVHNRWSGLFNVRVQNWANTSIKRMFTNGSGILLTFNFVAIGWIFFVLPDPEMAWQALTRLFGGA